MQNLRLQDYKKAQYPFEEYLQWIHAEQYIGTDDDMADNFEFWLSNESSEELIEHANTFSKMLLDLIEDPSTPIT